MSWLTEIFAWWTGNTIGTRVFTWRKGESVGEDTAGNRYYQERGGDRRWVVYRDEADASKIPPKWHGWLHHRISAPPTQTTYVAHRWEQPHQPNLTGTADAYRPDGSLFAARKRQHADGDYDAWSPDS